MQILTQSAKQQAELLHDLRAAITAVHILVSSFYPSDADGCDRRNALRIALNRIEGLCARFGKRNSYLTSVTLPFHTVGELLETIALLQGARSKLEYRTHLLLDQDLATSKLSIQRLPSIRPDSTLDVTRIIENLCLNAAQAGARNILLRARIASEQTPQLIVCIRDDGPGLPLHLRHTPFSAKTLNKKTGRGLGLRFCFDATHALGGQIILDHSNDAGTQFTVRLPLQD